MLRYDELKWQLFGLRAGLMNLRLNRGALGWKKTIGKIIQPVNTYTRFPEYCLFHSTIQPELTRSAAGQRGVVDIGSPKLFGFYLASRYAIKAHLTDLNERDIAEYSTMWLALRDRASGEAALDRQDARALSYPDGLFDVAYSMSAIEHVEGPAGDSRAMAEMWRVLKPSGLLVVSVPCGEKYVEQARVGFSYTSTQVDSRTSYFFQRVYDGAALEARLLAPLQPRPESVRIRTVYRSPTLLFAKLYHRFRSLVGLNILALLGFSNPLLSALLNRHSQGYRNGVLTSYGPVHSLADIYADAVVTCRKPARAPVSVATTGSPYGP